MYADFKKELLVLAAVVALGFAIGAFAGYASSF